MEMDNGWDGIDWEVECERLQKERDAAVKDLEKLMKVSNDVCCCEFCDNHTCEHGHDCKPIWRGVQTG